MPWPLCVRARVCVKGCVKKHVHTCTCMHSHKCTRTHTHTHTHTHAHTHTLGRWSITYYGYGESLLESFSLGYQRNAAQPPTPDQPPAQADAGQICLGVLGDAGQMEPVPTGSVRSSDVSKYNGTHDRLLRHGKTPQQETPARHPGKKPQQDTLARNPSKKPQQDNT